jgi:plastocyanin
MIVNTFRDLMKIFLAGVVISMVLLSGCSEQKIEEKVIPVVPEVVVVDDPVKEVTEQKDIVEVIEEKIVEPVYTKPTIEIVDMSFLPRTLEISVNETVVWQHIDNLRPLTPHMVKIRQGASELVRSTKMQFGNSFNYTFTEAGEYQYFDIIFVKEMGIGKITVK